MLPHQAHSTPVVQLHLQGERAVPSRELQHLRPAQQLMPLHYGDLRLLRRVLRQPAQHLRRTAGLTLFISIESAMRSLHADDRVQGAQACCM